MRPRRQLVILAAITFSLTAVGPPAVAEPTEFWKTSVVSDLRDGHSSGTSIPFDGGIVLGREFQRLPVDTAHYVWAGAVGGDGEVYVTTGTPGKLLMVRGDDVEVLMELPTSDLPALAVGRDGEVYVGTAPGGEVYRVGRDGSRELVFESGQGYVWCLAYSERHGLIVGTGEEARVYAVGRDGAARVLYESNDASITALACRDDVVLAGTSGRGLLVDISPGGDPRVIHDAAGEQISGIAFTDEGDVYFSETTVAIDEVFDEGNGYGDDLGEGAIYRVTDRGTVVGLTYMGDAPVTALGAGPDGEIWCGTGSRGLIFAIALDGDDDLVADLDEEQVLSISGSAGGWIVTTGVPGGAYAVSGERNETGTYESEVYDSRSTATWGEIRWRAEVPDGCGVELSTRSGNSEIPDDTWSKWERCDGEGEAPVPSPGARFLQWKAELRGTRGRTPTLRAVEVAHTSMNLPPSLDRVFVFDPDEAPMDSPGGEAAASARQSLPSGTEVTYSRGPSAGGARGLPLLLRGMRTAEWDAMDPNDDPLTFDVWIKSETEEVWKLMVEEIERTIHTWDSTSMPDGAYRLRVVVSDGGGNPPGEEATDERVSAIFTVDNTSPEITSFEVRRSGTAAGVRGSAVDSSSPIVGVECSLDYGEWVPAFAEDMMFDSLREGFRFSFDDVPEGEHAVAVRVLDRSGNTAVARRILK